MVGSIQGMSGASGYMPKASSTSQSSDNAFSNIASSTTQQTQKTSTAMSSEELLQMLTGNTSTAMSNVSSNDLLSFPRSQRPRWECI